MSLLVDKKKCMHFQKLTRCIRLGVNRNIPLPLPAWNRNLGSNLTNKLQVCRTAISQFHRINVRNGRILHCPILQIISILVFVSSKSVSLLPGHHLGLASCPNSLLIGTNEFGIMHDTTTTTWYSYRMENNLHLKQGRWWQYQHFDLVVVEQLLQSKQMQPTIAMRQVSFCASVKSEIKE